MRRFALLVALVLIVPTAAAASALVDAGTGQAYETAKVVVPVTFPVVGRTTFSDNFLNCRSGCARMHMGQDLMGAKMSPLVAAFDGVVTSLRREDKPGGGNYLSITAERGPALGWTAVYVHVNNDTPGTDDGKGTAAWSFPAGIAVGAHVVAGQLVGWRGDSGNAESTGPHLHFELHKDARYGWGGTVYNAYPSLLAAHHLAAPVPSGPHPDGSLLRHPSGSLVVVEGTTKRLVTPGVLAANGYAEAQAISVPAAELRGYPTRTPLAPRDGTVARDDSDGLWLVTGGTRVAVTSEQLAALGRPNPRTWPLSATELATLPVSAELPSSPLYPGALVRSEDGTTPTYVDGFGTLHLVDALAMASRGWTDADVAVLPAGPESPMASAAYGSPLPMRDGTFVQTPTRVIGVVSGGRFRQLWDVRMTRAYGYYGRPRLRVPDEVVRALPMAELTAR